MVVVAERCAEAEGCSDEAAVERDDSDVDR